MISKSLQQIMTLNQITVIQVFNIYQSNRDCKTKSQFSTCNWTNLQEIMVSSGHYFSGQTEVLAKSCGVKNFGMLFTAKSPIRSWRFNTLLATTHIALVKFLRNNQRLIHLKLDLFKIFVIPILINLI